MDRSADDPAGSVRYVLRIRDFCHLRAGAKCYPAGAGFILSDAAAFGRYLADRGHAPGAAVRVAVSTADIGHLLAAINPDPRLEHTGRGRVPGLCLHDHLDRAFPLGDADRS